MSHLFRWVRQSQTLASRSTSLLAGTQGSTATSNALIGQTIKPLYQISTSPLTTTSSLLQKGPEQAKKFDEQSKRAAKDDIVYTINFKQPTDYKKLFKDLYSLYGPMFIACHIVVSLCSLGFFCTLTYLAIDLTVIMPQGLMEKISDQMASMADKGGKFVAAYAIHKVLLPVRLVGSIWVTRWLSGIVKARKAAKVK